MSLSDKDEGKDEDKTLHYVKKNFFNVNFTYRKVNVEVFTFGKE